MSLDLPILRQHLKTAFADLCAAYENEKPPDAKKLLQGRSRLVDQLLLQLWESHHLPENVSLVAVGGYGRGELYPYSDIDLLILLSEEASPPLQEKIEHLVTDFWDVGLEVGHSVRTVSACLSEASTDISIQTALLEARYLAGDRKAFSALESRLRAHLDPLTFLEAKKLEQQQRHLAHGNTPYSLEAHCKDAPGGLRDLQIIGWIAKAAGFGADWQNLVDHDLLTAAAMNVVMECEDFLCHLRIRLHLAAKRREDRLLFDYQDTMAIAFGMVDEPPRRAALKFMQHYYRAAKTITVINTIVLQNLRAMLAPEEAETPALIDPEFQAVGDLLDIRSPDLFTRDPQAIFRAFRALQDNPHLTGMSTRTMRALWLAKPLIDDGFRQDTVNQENFLAIFRAEHGVVRELRRMNQFDILGAYLPTFSHIVGQMQYDLFHAYTVDQHILLVCRNLRRFSMSEYAHEYPVCSRLMDEFDRPDLLYIAALFHDIAKGREGDHSELGSVDAYDFCVQHKMSAEDTELVVWLVKDHLVFSKVAQKEDLSDPAVIATFLARVGNIRRLRALYLLTHADIRGTSPKVWSQWKNKLLGDLFCLAEEALSKDTPTQPAHGIIAKRKADALVLLRGFALPSAVLERLWSQLDTVYFLRHSAEEIAWHTRQIHYRLTEKTPVVSVRELENEAGLQVMVYTPNEDFIFLRTVDFFARNGFNVVDAKIHTTEENYALDSYVVVDTALREIDRFALRDLEQDLYSVLLHQGNLSLPIESRPSRQVRHFPVPPDIAIRADDKGAYLLSLTAADRPGLLYEIASTLQTHGMSICTARIATMGERAEDVFLIEGDALRQPAERLRLETELMDKLRIQQKNPLPRAKT